MNDVPSRRARLEVILAGHNGDVEALRSPHGHFSPETLSAAYARISRSPDPVPELRQRAREEVEQARRSNRSIVFGLGHHSVAEHAVLNFDVLGCSRLAIEALEWHRLCSFTEKSQRYITLDGDHVVPAELDGGEAAGLEQVIGVQNELYRRLLPPLLGRVEELNPGLRDAPAGRRTLEGWAKEDARYAVALATAGQLGFTANARNLELVVRRLRHAPLEEIRRLGGLLFAEARAVVPSLVILADEEAFQAAYGASLQDDYFRLGSQDLLTATTTVEVLEPPRQPVPPRRGDVTLLDHTPDPDGAVVSALLFAGGRASMAACLEAARGMTRERRARLVRAALAHLSAYDAPPRAFEEASFRFEVVVDASAMAQLKRHRMSTQHWGPYDPALGVTVPPAIADIGEEAAFSAVMERTAELHRALSRALSARGATTSAADYALTNAHRRRVGLTLNLRELYHFSRLREDGHAQWAIRRLAADMAELARSVAPATAQLLGGKDRYGEVFAAVMGQDPPRS